jgi:hypothetical protein
MNDDWLLRCSALCYFHSVRFGSLMPHSEIREVRRRQEIVVASLLITNIRSSLLIAIIHSLDEEKTYTACGSRLTRFSVDQNLILKPKMFEGFIRQC